MKTSRKCLGVLAININVYTMLMGLGIGLVVAVVTYTWIEILAKYAPEYARRLRDSLTLPYILAFISFVLVYAVGRAIVPAMIAAGISLYAPSQIIYFQQRKLKSTVLEQLSSAVELFSNTFLITKSIPRGIEAVAKHVSAPVGTAFQTAYSELTFGVSINEVADQLAEELKVPYAFIFASLLKSADKQGAMLSPLFRDLSYKIAAARDRSNFQHSEVSTVRYTNIFLLALPVPVYLFLLNNMPEVTMTFIRTTAGNVLITLWLVSIVAWVFLDRIMFDE